MSDLKRSAPDGDELARKMHRSPARSASATDIGSPLTSESSRFSHDDDDWKDLLSTPQLAPTDPHVTEEAKIASPSQSFLQLVPGSFPSKLATAPVTRSNFGEILGSVDTQDFESPASKARMQLLSIQAQMIDFASCLDELDRSPPMESSSGQLHQGDIRSLQYEVKELKRQLAAANERAELLQADNDQLRLASDRRGPTDPFSCGHDQGVDPQAIIDLASELIYGRKTVQEVTSRLYDLVEGHMTRVQETRDQARERVPPMERLRNVEGIMDVALSRIDELHKTAVSSSMLDIGSSGKKAKEAGFTITAADTGVESDVISEDSWDNWNGTD